MNCFTDVSQVIVWFKGDLVRKLKEEKTDAVTIKAAVTELKARIKTLDTKVWIANFVKIFFI